MCEIQSGGFDCASVKLWHIYLHMKSRAIETIWISYFRIGDAICYGHAKNVCASYVDTFAYLSIFQSIKLQTPLSGIFH